MAAADEEQEHRPRRSPRSSAGRSGRRWSAAGRWRRGRAASRAPPPRRGPRGPSPANTISRASPPNAITSPPRARARPISSVNTPVRAWETSSAPIRPRWASRSDSRVKPDTSAISSVASTVTCVASGVSRSHAAAVPSDVGRERPPLSRHRVDCRPFAGRPGTECAPRRAIRATHGHPHPLTRRSRTGHSSCVVPCRRSVHWCEVPASKGN